MKDAPDGTLWVQQVDVVVDLPTPSEPANEAAAGGVGRYSGTDTDYQEVVAWTVAADKVGELKEITFLSDNYAKTNLQVTVGDIVFATDWVVQGTIPLIFEDLKLAAGKVVKVECKSTDGTSITVDSVIAAKELG
jgi:hypothetical protein